MRICWRTTAVAARSGSEPSKTRAVDPRQHRSVCRVEGSISGKCCVESVGHLCRRRRPPGASSSFPAAGTQRAGRKYHGKPQGERVYNSSGLSGCAIQYMEASAPSALRTLCSCAIAIMFHHLCPSPASPALWNHGIELQPSRGPLPSGH